MVDFRDLPFQYQERAVDLRNAPSDDVRVKFGESRDQQLENHLSKMFHLTPAGFGFKASKELTTGPDAAFDSTVDNWDESKIVAQTSLPELMSNRSPYFDAHGNLVVSAGFYLLTWSVNVFGNVDLDGVVIDGINITDSLGSATETTSYFFQITNGGMWVNAADTRVVFLGEGSVIAGGITTADFSPDPSFTFTLNVSVLQLSDDQWDPTTGVLSYP